MFEGLIVSMDTNLLKEDKEDGELQPQLFSHRSDKIYPPEK